MGDRAPFSLPSWLVPQPPASDHWADHLRWLVGVMDFDDPALAFVASLLAYTVRYNGLTPRQERCAVRILERVRRMWAEKRLRCQLPQPEHQADGATDLAECESVGET